MDPEFAPKMLASTYLGRVRIFVGAHGLVQQCGDIFPFEPLGGAEYHDAILDGECVQVIQHYMVWLGQQCRLA
jgi:hypothetical protein